MKTTVKNYTIARFSRDMVYRVSAILCAVCFFISTVNAQQLTTNELTGGDKINTITTSVPLLMISPDARAGAMGDAGVATTPDANSIHWNPSKLAYIKDDMGFSVSYTPWLRALVPDINLAYLSGYKKVAKDQVLAVTLLYFSLGNIVFTNIVGEVTGEFNPNEFAFDIAYSRKLSNKISGGLALRYIYSNLTGGAFLPGGQETKPGQSIAADVSAYYQNDITVGGKDAVLGVGANISNIGSKISYTETASRNFIPINLRLGTSLTTELDNYNSLCLTTDINKLLVPTPPEYGDDSAGTKVIVKGKDPDRSVVSGMFGSFSDAPGGFKEEMRELTYSFGVEYWYDKQFAIRAGYFNEHKTKGNRKYFTLGAGLKYNVFGIDFSYLIPTTQRNPLENTLRFTLLFDFEAFKAQEKENKIPE